MYGCGETGIEGQKDREYVWGGGGGGGGRGEEKRGCNNLTVSLAVCRC